MVTLLQVRRYEKATRAFSCLEFFTTNQWRFVSDNPIRLLSEMSENDKNLFYFDVREIDWQSYYEIYVLGARRYILKDDLTSLPLARSNLKR